MVSANQQSPNTIVVLPTLPPGQCGLSGHTIQLWRWLTGNLDSPARLGKEFGWEFFVARNAIESAACFPDATIHALPRQADQLSLELEKTGARRILLQYVCYGFEKNGVPDYLVEGLTKWKNGDPRRRLIVMFHETWVWGLKNPFKRAFWYAAPQKAAIRELVKLSDVTATSNGAYRGRLASLKLDKQILLVPIGHNFVTEPSDNRNPKQLLVFGLERLGTIRAHCKLIELLVNTGLVESVVLAGSTDSGTSDEEVRLTEKLCPSVQLTTAFNFDFDDVPLSVRSCGLSLMDAPALILAKSGRFHLACALGQIPIAQEVAGLPELPLATGKNFISYTAGNEQAVADALQSTGTIERISNGAMDLSVNYFSWNEITERWRSVLDLEDCKF